MSRVSRFVEIHILSGSRRGHRQIYIDPEPLPLPDMPLRIGRHSNSGPDPAVLFDPEDAPTVSRRHLALDDRGTHFALTDEGSAHGTLLLASAPGGQPVHLEGKLPLPLGSVVRVALGEKGPICRISVGLASPFSHYTLVGRLGEGGMGEVFLARDTGLLQRTVVLKVIRRSLFQVAPDAERLLLKEAGIMAKLASPHVVRVFEAGKQDQVLYIAMEHLPGVTLANLALQCQRLGRCLPPLLAAALMRQALLGLHDAHELIDDATGQCLGVVHLDVSPNNLICTPRGEVKVIDFGVARARDQLSAHTAPDAVRVVGNPPYMSPEQIVSPQAVDRRADLFSAGAVLWELCTGRRLFERANMMATLFAVRHDPVPSLYDQCAEAPQGLALAVEQALRRDPDRRQDTARDFAWQIESVIREADPRLVETEYVARELLRHGVDLTLGGAPDDPALDLRPLPLAEVPEVLLHIATDPGSLSPAEIGVAARPASGHSLPKSQVPPTAVFPVPPTAVFPEQPAVHAPPPVQLPVQDDGALLLELPLTQDPLVLSTPDGGLVVRAAHLQRLDAEPRPVPLQLPGGEYGPPLLVQLQGRRLLLTVSPKARDQKVEIYRGLPRADNGHPTLLLPQAAQGDSFYFGHRRQGYQRVDYTSAAGTTGLLVLPVPLPKPHLRVSAPAGTTHLLLLCTPDPGRTDLVHLSCLFVQD